MNGCTRGGVNEESTWVHDCMSERVSDELKAGSSLIVIRIIMSLVEKGC